MNGADQRSGGGKPAVGGRSGRESAPAPPDRFREPCDVSPGRDWRAGTPSPGRRHGPLRLPDGTPAAVSAPPGGPGRYRCPPARRGASAALGARLVTRPAGACERRRRTPAGPANPRCPRSRAGGGVPDDSRRYPSAGPMGTSWAPGAGIASAAAARPSHAPRACRPMPACPAAHVTTRPRMARPRRTLTACTARPGEDADDRPHGMGRAPAAAQAPHAVVTGGHAGPAASVIPAPAGVSPVPGSGPSPSAGRRRGSWRRRPRR